MDNVIPLLRNDRPRAAALRMQRIYPEPTADAAASEELHGSIRLGEVDAGTPLVMVCEGYATGLSLRMATDHQIPVYVALDAYKLVHVVETLRRLHPKAHLLICGDDDWKSADHGGPNPGRRC